jgi:C1A family cysteine protease
MTRQVKRYGWVRDLPDQRDHLYAAPVTCLTDLPPSADLRAQCPPVYDQGQLGSCTANAIGAAIEFDLKKQSLADATPSRLFIYYNERAIEGTVDSDSGAQIRDGIKAVNKQGACPEGMWPYDIAKFAEKPSDDCYAAGLRCRAVSYSRLVQTPGQMKGCLAAGYPFVFGFAVYESFESKEVAQSGVVPMPKPGERVLGGHAVMAVGYDDEQRNFIVRNSWGSGWGQDGYFLMPYHYLHDPNLASDFWTVRMLSAPTA